MSIFKYFVLIQIILVVVCHGKPQKSEGDYDTSILKPCELAIWSCCQTDGRGPVKDLPTHCFERNKCKGLQWLGADACSGEVLNAVTAILSNSIVAPRFSASYEGAVMNIGDIISNTTIEYTDSCDGQFEEIKVHMPSGYLIIIEDSERMEMFGNSVEMPKTECTTVGGPDPKKPCVFPFKHEGNTFITCALAPNDDKHWCSTLVDEAGEHIAGNGNWGHCGSDCPFCSSG